MSKHCIRSVKKTKIFICPIQQKAITFYNIMEKKQRKILHIDMDAFYASIEHKRYPQYKNTPIIVGGKPENRSVVCAADYMARSFGVRSGMASSKAVRLCPKAILLPPDMATYKKFSQKIQKIFLRYSELVEPLSLDEAFIDVTEDKMNLKSGTLTAKKIKEDILRETGLTASAGVASSKFLAKIASDINKPNGLTVITPDKEETFINSLPVEKFFGVGKATAAKMHSLGIMTGADLAKIELPDMIRLFGKSGKMYFDIVNGKDLREVRPNRIRKSVGSELTFPHDINCKKEIDNILKKISAETSRRTKAAGAKGKTVTLKVRYDDFTTVTRSTSSNTYIDEPQEIYKKTIILLKKTDAGERKLRLIGITLSNLNISQNIPKNIQLLFSFIHNL